VRCMTADAASREDRANFAREGDLRGDRIVRRRPGDDHRQQRDGER